MSHITKWSFGNNAAVSLMTVLILIIGVVSYFTLPMEFLPSADNPQVTIVAVGQGTDSNTMETEVTSPLERAVAGVKGKKSTYSTTGDGFSKIDILFESGTDMKQAKQEVSEALSNVSLPPNVLKPSITQLNTSAIPVSLIAITFKDGITPENIKFIKEKIEPKYKDIKGVSGLQVSGTEESFVSVKLDNEELTKKQIPIQSVMGVLQGQNTAVALGEKIINDKTSNIKVIGDLTSLDKLKKLSVAPGVNLEDVAKIELSKPENVVSRFNGEDTIDIAITKDSNSNAVKVSKDIDKLTAEINKEYDNLEATIYVTSAEMVESSVHSMVKEVLLGALFATIVIMIFLRNIRSTFITIVSIPLSLCFTLFLLSRSGVTLNILTLGGVAVAVGRLVDDSIVVIENIFRKMQKEKFSVQMVIDATKEVGVAITASTLTTVAVFLPLGFVNGSLKQFLLPFALTVTYSLLASLIVAITVVPLMSAGLLKTTKLPEHKPAVRFTKLVTWSLNHKWVVLSLAFILFAGSIVTYFMMPKGAVDNSTADGVAVTLSYPVNTPIEEVKENALKFEEEVLKKEEIKYLFTQVGSTAEAAKSGWISPPTEANFTILLKNQDDTDRMIKEIEEIGNSYSDAKFTAAPASFMMGAASTNITIDIVGDNIADLEASASDIEEKIKDIKGIEEVTTNQDEKKTVYSLKVDPTKGNTEQVAQQLGVMLNKTPIGTVTLDEKQTMVILEPIMDTKSTEDLEETPIMTATGMVPVSKVATLVQEDKPTTIFHKDGETYLQLAVSVDPAKLSDINKEITLAIYGDKKENKEMEFPEGVEVFIGGASVQQADDFTDLFMTMFISVGLVFLIMVITFKSFRAPIAILFSLPLAAIGAILGLLVSGISVDITSLLGALMLIGIVVTNAIVLLDRVKQNEKTMIIRDAIVEASATRMRPIIMTAVATISAMLPLLFKKAETGNLVSQNLAVVVIGGLAMATLLTLIVIPCIYELFHFRKSKKQRLKQQQSHQIAG
ncbi:efflux RND transporter permease subunit [Bacillus sp. 31A1R]|uniref:Efflux RND transporter permease subunit n=1 Tax=Robertmurraya mangrovi TaxID=3098077 RepID=A0ABU5IT85_9BACI|nr:efflux RND transporter permease subunit [Bacillus sp. 31A1R]MDZ5470359.1 efflux RND transporter permease subunit [Bacillus sp. 31A1R]